MNFLFALASGAFMIISCMFLSQAIHEGIHVLQLRPYKASEIVILGRKRGENDWSGWVTGPFNKTGKSERRCELEAAIITWIIMYAIMVPYLLYILHELRI